MTRLILCIMMKVLKIGIFQLCSKQIGRICLCIARSQLCENAVIHMVVFLYYRDVPSSAALPIIHPALGRQQSMSDRAKNAMQGYLNHFLSNMDIVNSREV